MKRRSTWIFVLLVVAMTAVAMACLPGSAFARAGGGEGFNDDGGGGGGGGGGGNVQVIFYLVWWWLNFCYQWPATGISITAVVVVTIVLTHRQGLKMYQNSMIQRGAEVAGPNQVAQCRATLMAADPRFDELAFYQRVKSAFLKIQAGWCMKDLSAVRAFISDGIHERFDIQFQEMKALDVSDVMSDIQVQSIQLAEVTADDVFDVATVRIVAMAVDYRITTSTGKRHDGPTAPQPFAEYWSFIRRHGVTTDPNKPGLMEGHCPNCGAAIEMNQSAQCAQCKAVLRSGQFDWVLAVITQQSEWRPQRNGPIAGAEALRKSDPAFNRVALEDRASVMFWRKMLADRVGKMDPLRKVATDDYCAYLTKTGTTSASGRSYMGDCAVGSTHLLAVIPAEVNSPPPANGSDADDAGLHIASPVAPALAVPSRMFPVAATDVATSVAMETATLQSPEAMDRAVVEVWWEGQPFQQRVDGTLSPGGERKKMHQLYVLSRKPGVSSDPGTSVSSAHCPNCGGPVTSDLSNACSFCGTVLNDGTTGWVLSRIESAATQGGYDLMNRVGYQWGHAPVAGRPSYAAAPPSGLLAWAIRTAMADGVIDMQKEQMLEAIGARCGLSVEAVKQLVAMASHGALELPDPPNRAAAQQYLTAMAAMVVADGSINEHEMAFLSAAGRRFGFGAAEIGYLLRVERANRINDARDQLKMAKQFRRGDN
jgi:hypothetical protein